MPDSVKIVIELLVVALLSYLAGSVPTGYLIGKINGIDIRKHGSHNIGATNVRRVLGRDWSFICFACDFLKGYLPVLLFGRHMAGSWIIGAGYGVLVAAFASICGHIFPVWLRFKGGKGVATTLGVVTGIALVPVLVGGIIWLIVFKISKIVSLASMISVACIALCALIMKIFGYHIISWHGVILLVVIALLVIIRHKDNIKRLREGTENKFLKKKDEKKEE